MVVEKVSLDALYAVRVQYLQVRAGSEGRLRDLVLPEEVFDDVPSDEARGPREQVQAGSIPLVRLPCDDACAPLPCQAAGRTPPSPASSGGPPRTCLSPPPGP